MDMWMYGYASEWGVFGLALHVYLLHICFPNSSQLVSRLSIRSWCRHCKGLHANLVLCTCCSAPLRVACQREAAPLLRANCNIVLPCASCTCYMLANAAMPDICQLKNFWVNFGLQVPVRLNWLVQHVCVALILPMRLPVRLNWLVQHVCAHSGNAFACSFKLNGPTCLHSFWQWACVFK